VTTPKTHGIIAEFDSVDAIIAAANQVREAGYTKWDCHTPFPVHGLDDAMAIKQTKLPWLVLVMGISGCLGGMFLQWWTNAYDYVYIISGKPAWSLPANIPVMFEMTILFSALTAFFSMWIINNLPKWYNPLFHAASFTKVTDDRFVLAIESRDPLYGEATRGLLQSAGALAMEEVNPPEDDGLMPSKLKGWLGVVFSLMLLPPVMIASSMYSNSSEPRVHLVPDMDSQMSFGEQEASSFFADGRSMRAPIAGTYAQEDDHLLGENPGYYTGKEDGAYLTALPVEVTQELMARGQERFGIYCGVCHGMGGKGDGAVSRRAQKLEMATWVQPADLHTDLVKVQPPGQIFETMTNGIRTMPGYARQIPVQDRWAIVLYLQALQRASAGE